MNAAGIPVKAKMQIAAQDDRWVEEAHRVAQKLWQSLTPKQRRDGKERQLRNIQSVAEASGSWAALALFIRYQAARGEIPKEWAEETISHLENLREQAKTIASRIPDANENAVHMAIVSRVLGYAIRWHVWDVWQAENKAKEGAR